MKKQQITLIILSIIVYSCTKTDCVDLPDNVNLTTCSTPLLTLRSISEGGRIQFSMDSLKKPVVIPLTFGNYRKDSQQSFWRTATRPANYDAYNPNTNTYFIEFPFEQRLYKYDLTAKTRQEFIVSGFYSAPVFNQNVLYAINIPDNFGFANNPANYEIKTINQNDGSVITIHSSSFPLVSKFDYESMSSVGDGNGNIYFLSGTNLVHYDISSNTSKHYDLFPAYSSVNFQEFFGLEMRKNGNLLAIRNRDDNFGDMVDIVEINVNNPLDSSTVVHSFLGTSIDPNSEFYSTTYDPCDDTYYITSLDNFTNGTSFFYEIDLTNSIIKTENHSNYIMGVEVKR